MPPTPTTVYPLRDVSAAGFPHVVTELPSRKAAEEYEATGAFTTDPDHPNRIPDAEIPLPVDAPTHVVVADGGVVPVDQVETPAEAPATPEPPSTPTSESPATPGQEA